VYCFGRIYCYGHWKAGVEEAIPYHQESSGGYRKDHPFFIHKVRVGTSGTGGGA